MVTLKQSTTLLQPRQQKYGLIILILLALLWRGSHVLSPDVLPRLDCKEDYGVSRCTSGDIARNE